MEKAVQKIESDKKIGVVYCEADLFGEKLEMGIASVFIRKNVIG